MIDRRLFLAALSLLMFGMSGAPRQDEVRSEIAIQSFRRQFPDAYVQLGKTGEGATFATGFRYTGPSGTPEDVAWMFLEKHPDLFGVGSERTENGLPVLPALVRSWYSPGGGHRLLFRGGTVMPGRPAYDVMLGVSRPPSKTLAAAASSKRKPGPGYVFVDPFDRTTSEEVRSDWYVYFASRIRTSDGAESRLLAESNLNVGVRGKDPNSNREETSRWRPPSLADHEGAAQHNPCPDEGTFAAGTAQAYLTNPLNGEPIPVSIENLCNHTPLTLHGRMVVVEPASGILPTSETGAFEFAPNTPEFDDVSVYYHADNFFSMMADRGFPVPYGAWHLTIITRSPEIETAISYYPARTIYFGSVTPPYKNAVYEAAVIAHEVTHLLMYDLSASYLAWGLKESFALGEAYADYFGLVYRSYQLGHAEAWQQPVIGAYLVDETTWNLPRDLSATEPNYSGLSSVNYVGLAEHADPITVYDNSVIFSTALLEYDRIDGSDNSSSFVIEALLNHTEDLKFLPARNALMAAVNECALDPITRLLECCISGYCHRPVAKAFDNHGIGNADDEVTIEIEGMNGTNRTPDGPLSIEGAFPNPFAGTTRISFNLASPDHVRLRIYDVSGKLVEQMLNQHLSSGPHSAAWTPDGLSSGTYFFELSTRSTIKRGSIVYAK